MQSFRPLFRWFSRSTSRAIPHLRSTPIRNAPSPFLSRLKPPHQTRFASYNYQRFDGGPGKKQQTWSNIGSVYRAQYIWRNYRNPILVIVGGGGVFYIANLEQVPLTGRYRFNVVSPATEKQISESQYEQILQEFQGKILPENHPYTEMTARIVERMLPASGLQNEEWRVHVIDEPKEINAFVIPGGKVFVFTGILPIARDETGLAVVLGHEIAHNVAHHSAERISNYGVGALLAISMTILFDISGQFSNAIWNSIFNLPNSRTQEREADHIGLLIMAESCYDPSKAVDLWTRMDQAQQVQVPQFMSTHPSNFNRRELIKGWLPQAEAKYHDGNCGMTGRINESFQQAIEDFKGTRRREQRKPIPVLVGQGKRDDDDFW